MAEGHHQVHGAEGSLLAHLEVAKPERPEEAWVLSAEGPASLA